MMHQRHQPSTYLPRTLGVLLILGLAIGCGRKDEPPIIDVPDTDFTDVGHDTHDDDTDLPDTTPTPDVTPTEDVGPDVTEDTDPDVTEDADAGPEVCSTDDNHECLLHPSCGCEAGQSCDLDPDSAADGFTVCRSAGTKAELDECLPADFDCGQGLACIGRPTGVCRSYCSADADCGAVDLGNFCRPVKTGGGVSTEIPGAAVCTTYCNPFDSTDDSEQYTGCPTGLGCRTRDATVEASSPRTTTDCTIADEAKLEGDACTDFCAVGLMCLPDTEGARRCQRFCALCAPDCPGSGPSLGCSTGTCTELGLSIGSSLEAVSVGYCRL